MAHRPHPLADVLADEPDVLWSCSFSDILKIAIITSGWGTPVALAVGFAVGVPPLAFGILIFLMAIFIPSKMFLYGSLKDRLGPYYLEQKALLVLENFGFVNSGFIRLKPGPLSLESPYE